MASDPSAHAAFSADERQRLAWERAHGIESIGLSRLKQSRNGLASVVLLPDQKLTTFSRQQLMRTQRALSERTTVTPSHEKDVSNLFRHQTPGAGQLMVLDHIMSG